MDKKHFYLVWSVLFIAAVAVGPGVAQAVDVNSPLTDSDAISSGPTEQNPERTRYWHDWIGWAGGAAIGGAHCTGGVPTGGARPILFKWAMTSYQYKYVVVPSQVYVVVPSPWGAWATAGFRLVKNPKAWDKATTNWDNYVGIADWRTMWGLPSNQNDPNNVVGYLNAVGEMTGGWWAPATFEGNIPGSLVQEWLDNPGRNYGVAFWDWPPYSAAACPTNELGYHGGAPYLFFQAIRIDDLAASANPASGATEVAPIGIVLSWVAGDNAGAHDVYLGTNFTDVNTASRTLDPNGVRKSVGQIVTFYPTVGSLNLDYGVKYYWRIDEVNSITTLPYKGKVWFFTTTTGKASDPLPRDTSTNVDSPALLSWTPGRYAAATNGHDVYLGTSQADVTNATVGTPLGVYKGQRTDPNFLAQGLAVLKTYYWRIDEVNGAGPVPGLWKGDIWRFTTAAGKARNPSPADGIAVASPRDVNLTWIRSEACRLYWEHDVFFGTDFNEVNTATTSVHPNVTYAQRDVNNNPLSPLEFSRSYYWRVDEINSPSVIIRGDVWGFIVPEYITIEDFNAYTSDIELHVNWDPNDWPTCSSGTGTGAWVYDDAYDMRFTYDNNGTDASNDYYSEIRRDFGPTGVNWTVGSATQLPKAFVLSFRGQAANQAHPTYDRMYVCLTDTNNHKYAVNHSDPNAQKNGNWQEWNIALTQFSSNGVDLRYVRYLSLGFGKQCNYSSQLGGVGQVLFDDIRLYPPRCVAEYVPAGDFTDDCTVNLDDLDFMATDWLNADANLIIEDMNEPNAPVLWYMFDDGTGALAMDSAGNNNGQVLNLTNPWRTSGGYDDGGYLMFSGAGGDLEIDPCLFADHIGENITISVWIKCDAQNYPQGATWSPLIRASGTLEPSMDLWCPTPTWTPEFPAGPQVHFRFPDGNGDGDPGDDLAACSNFDVQESDFMGRWHHWVFVKDGTNDYMANYHDGQLVCDATDANANNIGEIETPTQITVANFNQFNNPSWAGGMDDMRIYNYALSPGEIGYLTTKGAGTIFLPLTSPADLYVETPNIVNFKDLAVFANNWLTQQFWPTP